MSILYVDDNLERMQALKGALESLVDVEFAPNGWEGLGAVMMYKPKLVVLNLFADVMTGLEALRLIRTEESLNALPIIGFTDSSDSEASRRALELGCVAVLEVPDVPALAQAVQQHLPAPAGN